MEAASPSGSADTAEAAEAAQARGHPGRLWIAAALAPLLIGPLWLKLVPRLGPGFAGGTFAGSILLTTLACCAVTDLHRRKVPNWATYTAFLWALGLNLFGSLTGSLHELGAGAAGTTGAVGISEMLQGSVICFVVTFLAFSLSGGGAGDVKLATVIGTFLGGRHGLMALGWSYMFAGLAILGWIVGHLGPLRLVRLFVQKVGSLIFPAHIIAPVMPATDFLKKKVPLAPSFACGTLYYLGQLSTW